MLCLATSTSNGSTTSVLLQLAMMVARGSSNAHSSVIVLKEYPQGWKEGLYIL